MGIILYNAGMNKLLSTLGFPKNASKKEIAEGLVYGAILFFIIASYILGSILPS